MGSDKDLLGFDRFDAHVAWRCTGHVAAGNDADPDDFEDLFPSDFVMERHLDRWLLTSDDRLLVVGDGRRDLVAGGGGLLRHPAGQGLAAYFSSSLLRQVGMFNRPAVAELVVAGSQVSHRAGRDAVDVRLGDGSGQEMTIGVDDETGVWTWFSSPDLVIAVDELEVGTGGDALLLQVLALVPEIDLSRREPVSAALEGVRTAVQTTSGLQVEALEQDDETLTFRFLLLGEDGEPVGMVSRQRTQQLQDQAIFGGTQSWRGDDEWSLHVDTSGSDPRWVHDIMDVAARP